VKGYHPWQVGDNMTLVVDKREVEKIEELARKYTEPHQPRDYRLKMVPECIRQEAWYCVIVEPRRQNVCSYDYNARLVGRDGPEGQEGRKVLLVPVLPEE
jgi:hypothetical protein